MAPGSLRSRLPMPQPFMVTTHANSDLLPLLVLLPSPFPPPSPPPKMAGRLNLASPISPTPVTPSSTDWKKGATVFPSHVRRTFQRFPTDYTGELVRLLDDLSTATHSIAAYVTEGSENVRYGTAGASGGLNPIVASKKLYKALSHGELSRFGQGVVGRSRLC